MVLHQRNTFGALLSLFAFICFQVNRSKATRMKLACEHATLTIDCGSDLIDMCNANYGRTNRKECSGSRQSNTRCKSTASSKVMFSKCHGKSKCQLQASNKVFGDPCPGTYKYLNASYCCQNKELRSKLFQAVHRCCDEVIFSLSTTISTSSEANIVNSAKTSLVAGSGRRTNPSFNVFHKKMPTRLLTVFSTTSTTALSKNENFHLTVTWVLVIIAIVLICLAVSVFTIYWKTVLHKKRFRNESPNIPSCSGSQALQQSSAENLGGQSLNNSAYMNITNVQPLKYHNNFTQEDRGTTVFNEDITYGETNWYAKYSSSMTEIDNPAYQIREEEDAAYIYRETKSNELYSDEA